MAPWDPPDDTAIDAAQTPGTGTAPIRADLTNTVLKTLRDGIGGLYSATLQAIAPLSPAADTFVWFSDALTAQLGSITAYARGFLGQPDAAGMRAYIGALSAGGAPAAHQASHQSGQGDALTGAVDANARMAVWYNGTPVAARRAVDLIEGSGVTMTPVDDAANEVVRVTLNAGGGGGGGGGTLADLSILPRHMVARETENLIPDPELEVSFVVGATLVWYLSPANISLFVAGSTNHPSCRYYMQFPGGKTSDYYAYTMPPPGMQITAGEEYWVEFDTHLNTGTTTGASTLDIGLEFLAVDGTTISRAVVSGQPSGAWATSSGAITVPANALYAVPFVRRLANSDAVNYRVTKMALRRRRGTNTTRDKAITLAKVADGTANRLLGRDASGVAAEITVAGSATLSAGVLTVSGGGSGGGLVNTPIKTAAYPAAAGDRVRTDTTAGGFTVTLPTAPTDGTQVAVADTASGGSWQTNLLTVARGTGDTINGIASSYTGAAGGGGEIVFTYSSANTNWQARYVNRGRAATVNGNLSEFAAAGNNMPALRTNIGLSGLEAAGNALKAFRANAAGTAFEAVTFPGVFPAFYAGPSSAAWIRSAHWTGASTTQAMVANTIYFVPFLLAARYAPTKCAINVSTAAAGSCDVTFWSFDAATGKVGTTKYFNATLSTSATGNATGTIAPGTLEPGWYVYRLTFNAAPTLRAHATNVSSPWGFDPTGNNSPITMKTWASGAYTTNPASPEDVATNFGDSGGSAPLLVLQ